MLNYIIIERKMTCAKAFLSLGPIIDQSAVHPSADKRLLRGNALKRCDTRWQGGGGALITVNINNLCQRGRGQARNILDAVD